MSSSTSWGFDVGREAHVPVLLREALEYLSVRPGGVYVDCTAGAGGHSAEIAGRLERGRLLAMDRDPKALESARKRLAEFGEKVKLVQAHFENAADVMRQNGATPADGLLADVGLSQMQLADPQRGFSFAVDAPLDMRMDPAQEVTAATIVNQADERELADLIYQFGEERRSRKIASAIVRARPIGSTLRLAEVIRTASGPSHHQRIHPATRTFQALRIAVNDELGELERMLASLPAPGLFRRGARIVIITFHSLEDRIVKHAFREWKTSGFAQPLTKHVVRPGDEETRQNPRARSAKLRAAEVTTDVQSPKSKVQGRPS